MCNLKYTLSFLILCGLIIFASCNDADVSTPDASKKNDKFLNGPLTSLEGTVWIHHPDTDPESQNWFNLFHSPKFFEPPDSILTKFPDYYPWKQGDTAKLLFTVDRIFDGTKRFDLTEPYYYIYSYPKIVVSKYCHCKCSSPLSFSENYDCECGATMYVGHINENTMILHEYSPDAEILYREVVLIRIK